MKPLETRREFVVCIRNDDYETSLELRKIYQTIADTSAERHQMIRVIDESGDDYLFPADYFIAIQLPQKVEDALALAL